MVMNNKAQLMLFGLMLMVFLLFAAVILIDPIKEAIDIARIDLDCTNSSIRPMQKATCIIVDAYLPYFIGVVLVGSAAYLFYRTTRAE